MYTTPVGVRPVAVIAMLAAALLASSCRVIRESEPTLEEPDPLAFRIENATPATADVTITISAAETSPARCGRLQRGSTALRPAGIGQRNGRG
ncbi:MAG: hypothetical protein ACYSVY_21020 [Planctomycetota bacterium]